jgi:hypothetical protein
VLLQLLSFFHHLRYRQLHIRFHWLRSAPSLLYLLYSEIDIRFHSLHQHPLHVLLQLLSFFHRLRYRQLHIRFHWLRSPSCLSLHHLQLVVVGAG